MKFNKFSPKTHAWPGARSPRSRVWSSLDPVKCGTLSQRKKEGPKAGLANARGSLELSNTSGKLSEFVLWCQASQAEEPNANRGNSILASNEVLIEYKYKLKWLSHTRTAAFRVTPRLTKAVTRSSRGWNDWSGPSSPPLSLIVNNWNQSESRRQDNHPNKGTRKAHKLWD